MSEPTRPFVARLLRRAVGGARRRFGRSPRQEKGAPSVAFEGGRGGPVEEGETLLTAARRFDVELDSFCGGNCSCGTCRVRVTSGGQYLTPVEGHEEAVLGVARDRGDRLACQARVMGPVIVEIPEFFGG